MNSSGRAARLRFRVSGPQRLGQDDGLTHVGGAGAADARHGKHSRLNIQALTPEIRARIGYLTEEHQLYNWMSVQDCGEFQSKFFANWNNRIFRGIAGHFGLKPAARVKDLSRGERAGLCLALTLAPEPELLLLDDPEMDSTRWRTMLIESMIYLTRKSDRTIFFSSHDISDVERVADYIAVLDRSVLRACCPLEKFQESVRQVRLRFSGAPPALPKIPGLLQAIRTENELRVTCAPYNGEAEKSLRALSPMEMETCRWDWRTPSSAIWASAARRHSSCRNWRRNHESTDSKRLRENLKVALIALVVFCCWCCWLTRLASRR